jgi:hypothetical protein
MTLTNRGDMKKLFSLLSTLLLTSTIGYVGQVEADANIELGVGYRSDDFTTKVKAPDDVRLNTYSELRFRDIEICTLNARIKSTCGDCVYYRADGFYGWVFDGDVRETDQLSESGTTQPACNFKEKLHNHSRGRYVAGFNVAIGYPLNWCLCDGLQLTPTIGFSYDTIRLGWKNKDRISSSIISDLDFSSCSSSSSSSSLSPSSSSSSSHKRHSTFRSTWWGPFIGLDFCYNSMECFNLYGELEFHWARARRDRHTDIGLCFLDHHKRSREAWGWNVRVGSIYYMRCNTYLDGWVGYKDFSSHKHRDRLEWRSWQVGVALGYTW